MRKVQDKEYMERLLQDLRVKVRDVEDFTEKKKLCKIIEAFDKGIKEEYPNKKDYH
jgi:hypothetical protein